MDIEKQKQIYTYIQRDLHILANPSLLGTQDVFDLQLFLQSETAANCDIHHDNICIYNHIIATASNVVKTIGLPNNSISYSKVIENMVFNGYFSCENPLSPFIPNKNVTPLDNEGFFGFDVICGHCVCRHFAEFHKDIFCKMNQYDDLFYGYHWYLHKNFSPTLDNKFNFFTGDHVTNLLKYNGQYYIYDMTNKNYFYLANQFSAEQYSNNLDKAFLFYSPFFTMVFNIKDYEHILEQLHDFEESSLKVPMSIQELNEILNETNVRFYNNFPLLNEFRKEMLPYMKKLVDNLHK